MIRAVPDTNVVVSAVVVPQGIPAQVLAAAESGRIHLAVSSHIVAETWRTLRRDRVMRKYRLGPSELEGVRMLLEEKFELVEISAEVNGVATHPEDDLVLATALSAKSRLPHNR